jgi:hypothetical protein
MRSRRGSRRDRAITVLNGIDAELERACSLCQHVQEIIERMDWSPYPVENDRHDLIQLLSNIRLNIIQARVPPMVLKHQLKIETMQNILRSFPE